MGNFYGGSTIIKGGKFASHDPADDSVRYTSQKKKSATTQTKASNKKSFKAKKPQGPRKLLKSARKSLLHIIIDQMLMGRESIKIPKTTHPDLQAALEVTVSPAAWAKNQAEFKKLYAKKQKQHTVREQRRKHREKTTAVEVEVKRKRPLKGKQPVPPPAKPEPTPQERYQANRMALMRNLADQMIKRAGALSVPRIDSVLLAELKASGSPLLWLQAQPYYEAVFKARYLVHQKATAPAPKKPTQPPRKKKKKKQKLVAEGGTSQGKAAQGKPKKKRAKQYYEPYEKPSRPVTPLSDAPVSYILKQLDKAADEALNLQKIDWDLT